MSDKTSVRCGPCSREGTAASSPTRFCVNCNESLCSTCTKQHQKFTSTRNHTFLKEPPSNTTSSIRSLSATSSGSSVVCSKHVGKVLESFCNIHDELCCSVCVAVDHSKCQRPDGFGVVAIENAAHGITVNTEFTKVCSTVRQVIGEMETLKSRRLENLQCLSIKKSEIAKNIAFYREKMTERLVELERATQAELGHVYVNTALQIETDIDLCNDVTQSLEASPVLNHQDELLNDIEMFVHMKMAEKRLVDGKKIIESVSENLDKEVMEFKVDLTFEQQFNRAASLGKFVLAQHSYKAILLGEYKISPKYDAGQRQDILDCGILPDGRPVIIQGTDRKIKLLDTEYNVTDQLDLPGKPFGVSVTSSKEVIVSLKDAKFLQFINVSGKLKLTKVIKVGVECYGVAYRGGDVFVACGGGLYEAKPQLRVYNTNGVLTRIIEKGADGKQIFSNPRNVALNAEATIIYISDMDRGIVTFDMIKSVISGFWHRGLKSPRGIVVDEYGNVIVCGHHSHNIMQFTSSGKVICTILTEKDGITFPLSICMASKRLIVTSDKSKCIKVFALT